MFCSAVLSIKKFYNLGLILKEDVNKAISSYLLCKWWEEYQMCPFISMSSIKKPKLKSEPRSDGRSDMVKCS